ncbi:31938_t:CDS:1, partial [Racocetra persica]
MQEHQQVQFLTIIIPTLTVFQTIVQTAIQTIQPTVSISAIISTIVTTEALGYFQDQNIITENI